MKIQILKQEAHQIDFLIEREEGTYNNVNVSATFTDDEIQGFTEDQIKTLAYNKVKDVAIRVFTQIEPLTESENPVGFKLVKLPVVEQPQVIIEELIDEEKAFMAEAIIQMSTELENLKQEINILKGGN